MRLDAGALLYSAGAGAPLLQLELADNAVCALPANSCRVAAVDCGSARLLRSVDCGGGDGGHSAPVIAIAASGNTLYAVGAAGWLRAYDLRTGAQCWRASAAPGRRPTFVACGPDGAAVALASDRAGEGKKKKKKKKQKPPSSSDCGSSSDSDSDDDADGPQIDVFDARKAGEPLVRLPAGHSASVQHMRFASAKHLCSGGADGLVNVYDLSQCNDGGGGDSDECLSLSVNADASVAVCRCSPVLADEFALAAATDDGRCGVWSAATGDRLASWLVPPTESEDRRPFLVDVHPTTPDAAGGESWPVAFAVLSNASGHIALRPVLAAASGKCHTADGGVDGLLECMTACGHADLVRCTAFDRTSGVLYTGADDGTVCAGLVRMDADSVGALKKHKDKGKKRGWPY